eukprot:sb/3466067/
MTYVFQMSPEEQKRRSDVRAKLAEVNEKKRKKKSSPPSTSTTAAKAVGTVIPASMQSVIKLIPIPAILPKNNSLAQRYSFIAKNLSRWSHVPEVPGERDLNNVLGEVMNSCDTSPDEREIALMVAPSSTSRSSSVAAGSSSVAAGGSSAIAGSGTEGNSAVGSPDPSVTSGTEGDKLGSNAAGVSGDKEKTALVIGNRGRRKKNTLSLKSKDPQPEDAVDYGSVYRYLSALIGDTQPERLRSLHDMEKRVVCSLFKDLFADMAKRNLHKHKQFLLQRYFDFTSQKVEGRSVTNPYKLKGHMLHLPPLEDETTESNLGAPTSGKSHPREGTQNQASVESNSGNQGTQNQTKEAVQGPS